MGSFGAAIERKEAVVSLDGAKLILEGEREGCFPHSVALGLHSKDWSRLTRGSTLAKCAAMWSAEKGRCSG